MEQGAETLDQGLALILVARQPLAPGSALRDVADGVEGRATRVPPLSLCRLIYLCIMLVRRSGRTARLSALVVAVSPMLSLRKILAFLSCYASRRN